MTQHTATPWTREKSVIKSKSGAVVACVSNVSAPQNAEADADFIVLACNAHADLVDELSKAEKIILAMLNAMTPAQKTKVSAKLYAADISPDGMTRYHERRAALAKAGAA